jgi:tetratricopeptide (TPR) repeat protein
MLRLSFGRHLVVLAALVCAVVLFASPGYAQTAMIKGKVVDGAGKPLEKAKVLIEYKESSNRKYEVTTNKKGEFIQIGLPSGAYKVTASFKDLGSQSFDVRATLSVAGEVNFVLGGGAAGDGGLSKEAAAKNAAIKKVFEEGVGLSKAGSYDEAIAKFNEAIGLMPTCADCYYNIGYAYTQKKDLDQAETAFLKAVEVKPTYVDAFNGLATVYNAQKKFDKAQEASKKAAELAVAGSPGGTAGVDAQYNQGVIAWNAGNIEAAKAAFEEVIKMKPDHADAHYQLGMANLNKGQLPEAAAMFEKYLELAPQGQYVAQAKGILSQIKK